MTFYRSSCKTNKSLNDNIKSKTTTASLVSSNSKLSVGDNTSESSFVYVDAIFHNNNRFNATDISFTAFRQLPIVANKHKFKVAVASISGNVLTPPLLSSGDAVIAVRWSRDPDVETFITDYTFSWYDIYSVADFVRVFNEACITLWADYQNNYDFQYGAGTWTNNANLEHKPPGMVFDTQTRLFTLYGGVNMATPPDDDSPTVNDLFFDEYLLHLLYGIDAEYVDFVPYNLYPLHRVNFYEGFNDNNVVVLNGLDFIENTQDSPSVNTWPNYSSLIITSPSIGVRPTEIAFTGVHPITTSNNNYEIIGSFPITADLFLDKSIVFTNNSLQFNDIISEGPINSISFDLYYLTHTGTINKLRCPPGGTLTVKLVFAHTLFTSN